MSSMTTGIALISLLEQYGVEHVFGIPGVHTIELYRGLAASNIQHHTPRHEQGAGFMADGYARVSGKPGVCFVITGPGLTNIATPMGQALADSIPMLVISSVNDSQQTPHARGELHEMPNQLALSEQLSRFSVTIRNSEELSNALARAFTVFRSARPGPVHLQLPVSLLGEVVDENICEQVSHTIALACADSQNIDATVVEINKSQRPLILAGGGSRHCANELSLLAETIDAPVLMTINARGVLATDHPLAVSASGTLQAARDAVNEADLILAIGTELAATDYDQYKNNGFKINATLIHCDIDPMQLNNNFQSQIGITADSKMFISALLEQLPKTNDKSGATRARRTMAAAQDELSGEMKRHLKLLNTLRDSLPGAIFVGDSTQLMYSGNMIFNTDAPNRWFNSSVGFGTLGFALPASTGAAIAAQGAQGAQGAPVVCIIGDGGLQFVLGELGALKDTNLPVAIIVWCNQGYREIKTTMENANVSTVGVEFTVPDYLSIASAYGIKATSVNNDADLCSEIQKANKDGVPILIELQESEIMADLTDS